MNGCDGGCCRRRLGEGGVARGYSVWCGGAAGVGGARAARSAELEVGAPAERLPHRAAYYRAFPARLDAAALAYPDVADRRCIETEVNSEYNLESV